MICTDRCERTMVFKHPLCAGGSFSLWFKESVEVEFFFGFKKRFFGYCFFFISAGLVSIMERGAWMVQPSLRRIGVSIDLCVPVSLHDLQSGDTRFMITRKDTARVQLTNPEPQALLLPKNFLTQDNDYRKD